MKILFLPSTYPNEYSHLFGIFCRDHALALKKAGLDVCVIAVVPVSLKDMVKQKRIIIGLKQYTDNDIITYRYLIPSIPKLRWLNIVIQYAFIQELYRRLKRSWGRPDIIQVHEYAAGYAAYKINRKEHIPYVVTEHSSAFQLHKISSLQNRIAKKVFENASYRIAVSNEFCRLLAGRFNLCFNYIPNVVNIES